MSVKYCLPCSLLHLAKTKKHPAARSLCDSWASCLFLCRVCRLTGLERTLVTSHVRRPINCPSIAVNLRLLVRRDDCFLNLCNTATTTTHQNARPDFLDEILYKEIAVISVESVQRGRMSGSRVWEELWLRLTNYRVEQNEVVHDID